MIKKRLILSPLKTPRLTALTWTTILMILKGRRSLKTNRDSSQPTMKSLTMMFSTMRPMMLNYQSLMQMSFLNLVTKQERRPPRRRVKIPR